MSEWITVELPAVEVVNLPEEKDFDVKTDPDPPRAGPKYCPTLAATPAAIRKERESEKPPRLGAYSIIPPR